MKTFTLSTFGLLMALVASSSASIFSNRAHTLSQRHNTVKSDNLTARMQKQRRDSRKAKRSSSASSQQKKRDLKTLLAAKMVARKATRSTLGQGTTDVQPANIAPGTATSAEGCTVWHTAIAGEVCLGVIDKSEGLTLEDFIGLNPDVGATCQELQVGLAYCIDTDHQDADSDAGVKNANSASKCSSSSSDDSDDDNNAAPTLVSVSASVGTSRNGATPLDPVSVPAQAKPSASASASSGSSSSGSGATDEAGFNVEGLIKNIQSECGPSGATSDMPNGSLDFLNCGISKSNPNSPWTPPTIAIHDVVVKELNGDGIFAPCQAFFPLFEKYGKQYDIPPIFLASFAMQESSCQQWAKGDNGGAWGLMQITTDKCGGAPDGDCSNADYNVGTGAKYFRDTLDANNGNLLLSIGAYNGWQSSMTYAQATAAAYSSCCVCQNNLDYLLQFLNGWANEKDGGQMKPYNNLAVCGGSQSGNSKRSIAGRSLMSNLSQSS